MSITANTANSAGPRTVADNQPEEPERDGAALIIHLDDPLNHPRQRINEVIRTTVTVLRSHPGAISLCEQSSSFVAVVYRPDNGGFLRYEWDTGDAPNGCSVLTAENFRDRLWEDLWGRNASTQTYYLGTAEALPAVAKPAVNSL
jgi:hypothetical protein